MSNTVMIIDDDREMLQFMKIQLEPLYFVVCAPSGPEALELLSHGLFPRLILLDIAMPGMDGYEVLGKLKSDKKLSHIPVVFLTGMTDEGEELKGLNTDAVDYLKKPVAGKILRARVQHYITLYAERPGKNLLDMDRIHGLPEQLTEREWDVVKLMAEFRSDREICELLNISMPYAKKLVAAVKTKLGLEKRGDIRDYLIR